MCLYNPYKSLLLQKKPFLILIQEMPFFQDHIIVAVFADNDSPLIGLRNLVMPIR